MPSDAPRCYLCVGKDCRKADGHRKLARGLDEAGVDVTEVRCQKVCKGPVVGVERAGRPEWFGRLRGGKSRRAAVALVLDPEADLPDRLARRRVAKRSGRLRR